MNSPTPDYAYDRHNTILYEVCKYCIDCRYTHKMRFYDEFFDEDATRIWNRLYAIFGAHWGKYITIESDDISSIDLCDHKEYRGE